MSQPNMSPIQQFVLRDVQQNATNLKDALSNERTRSVLRRAPEVLLDILTSLNEVSMSAKILLLESEEDGEPASAPPPVLFNPPEPPRTAPPNKPPERTPAHPLSPQALSLRVREIESGGTPLAPLPKPDRIGEVVAFVRNNTSSPTEGPSDDFIKIDESAAAPSEPPPTPLPGTLAEEPSPTRKFREGSGQYQEGMFQGLYPRSLVECRLCLRRVQAHVARAEEWPALNRCAGPHEDPPAGTVASAAPVAISAPVRPATVPAPEPVRPATTPTEHAMAAHVVAALRQSYPYPVSDTGVVLEGPMEGLSLSDKTACRRCKMSLRVASTGKWKERDLCKGCGEDEAILAAAAPPPPAPPVSSTPSPPEEALPEAVKANTKPGARYKDAGAWTGLWPYGNTECRECGERVRNYMSRKLAWPEPTLCPKHGPEPPEDGGKEAGEAEAPASLPSPPMTTCTGCGREETVAWAQAHWPLLEFCDRCEQATTPTPTPLKSALCEECHERPPLTGALLCNVCTARRTQAATQEFIERTLGVPLTPPAVVEAAPILNGKVPNPHSRKRPRPIGSAGNWHEKREERYGRAR